MWYSCCQLTWEEQISGFTGQPLFYEAYRVHVGMGQWKACSNHRTIKQCATEVTSRQAVGAAHLPLPLYIDIHETSHLHIPAEPCITRRHSRPTLSVPPLPTTSTELASTTTRTIWRPKHLDNVLQSHVPKIFCNEEPRRSFYAIHTTIKVCLDNNLN